MSGLIIALAGATVLLLASPWLHFIPGHHRLAAGGPPEKGKCYVQAALTFVIVPVCLYVLFFGAFGANEKNWAAGFLGTIIGFWFGKA